jgi:hypothetical protein
MGSWRVTGILTEVWIESNLKYRYKKKTPSQILWRVLDVK